jgi:hypothetical protein
LPDIPALNELKRINQWVAFRLPDKIPINPHTGRNASTDNPATWGTYEQAVQRAQTDGLTGVGFVLSEDDDLTGYDFDKCRNKITGHIDPWARRILNLADTYSEISPSGTGIRMFARGKLAGAIKYAPARVEAYSHGRFLTVTGNWVEGTPNEINAAPQVKAACRARVKLHQDTWAALKRAGSKLAFKNGKVIEVAPDAPSPNPDSISERAQQATVIPFRDSLAKDPFWENVNRAAMDNQSAWVQALFPAAKFQTGTGAWRVSSQDLGRDLEEDLSIHPNGIRDWGTDDLSAPSGKQRKGAGSHSPISLVKLFRNVDAAAAAKWLCEQLGKAPEAFGWKEPAREEAPQQEPPRANAQKRTLEEVHKAFHYWLGAEYDTDVIDAVLATAASERLTGDPLWLLVISGPGAAKTETVQALSGCGAHVTSTIQSEGALLSATSQKQRTKKATGGLLRKIGDRGLLVVKDVTSILSSDRNIRASVLAAIREIYDGRWERTVGSDGGQSLTWVGRIAIVGAVTTAWDSAHSVVAAMGDRFVLIRIDSNVGRKQSGGRAIRNTGVEKQMRQELADVVAGIIDHADVEGIDLNDAEIERILNAADIVTMARTAVERDYRGDVIGAHAPEMPTRFAKQLTQMVRGSVAIGMSRERAMELAIRCARDSIPPLRLAILLDIGKYPDSRPGDVRKRIGMPWMTTKREMEALTMLGMLTCDEESKSTGSDGEERTIWRYQLAEDFDRATLLAMAGQQAVKESVLDLNNAPRQRPDWAGGGPTVESNDFG